MTDNNGETSASIQSAMVEEALENSLPAQIAALSQARREHAVEVSNLEAMLTELKDQYAKGKREKESLVIQSNALISSLCSLEEEGSRRMLHASEMEKESARVMGESVQLKWNLQQREQQIKAVDRKYSECLRKIEEHKQKIAEQDKSSPPMKELEAIKQRIARLKNMKNDLQVQKKTLTEQLGGQGKPLNETKQEISDLEVNANKTINSKLLDDLKAKLEERRETREKLQTANIILQKKNAALLTRLTRQASDEKQKCDQLSEQIRLVENKIEAAKAKLC